MGTAFLIITTSCTRECPYCFYVTGAMDRTTPEMPLDELSRCIGTLAGGGYRHLILTGGEPLLRPDLPDIVSAASRAGMQTLLLTNGEFLTEELCASLAGNGLGAISVSVDSNERGIFKSSLDAVLLARGVGALPVTVITALTRENVKYVEGLREWAKKEGIGIIFQPAYIPCDTERYRDLSLHELDGGGWLRLKGYLDRWGADCGTQRYLSLFYAIYEEGRCRPSSCSMGREAIVVDCDGSVYPCFHRRDLSCGNIIQDDADTVFGRLRENGLITARAPCYGEHCLSLFFGQV